MNDYNGPVSIPKLYLDTNVFDHILHKKGGITDEHVSRFQAGLDSKKFLVPIGLLAIEETLLALESNAQIASLQLRLIEQFSNDRFILKPPAEFLVDDIRGFVTSTWVSPFLEDESIRKALRELLMQSQVSEGLEAVCQEVREQKEQFKEVMIEAMDRVARDLSEIQGEPPVFQDYFNDVAPFFAEEYASRAGLLEECQEKGIKRLLEIKSVRLSIGANLSLAYGQIVQGWSPNLGDGIDMRHTVPASACNVFICNDTRLRKIIKRVPISNFRVVDFLSFVERIL